MQGKLLGVIATIFMLTVLLTACGAPAPTPADEVVVEQGAMPTSAPVATGGTTFVVDGERSVVRFILDEELRGQPKTVVGETNAVEGRVSVDLDDHSTATISPIRIDAGSFVTDSDMRNGAIRRFILQTGQAGNEAIVFTPSDIQGLPGAAAIGEPFDLKVTGDLQIRTITQQVIFDVSVTPNSETELRITGKTVVARADFELQIPNVPNVANVEEEVELELELVAVAQ